MRFVVWVWLVTRLFIFGVAGITVRVWPALYAAHGAIVHAPLSTIDGVCVWDCPIYGELARAGYQAKIYLNFWPLLPWLARPLVWLHVPPPWAVVVVANLAALGAFAAVYAVFVRLAAEDEARAALLLFAAYPFAFFFGSGYPESLMVLAGAGALWLALEGRHLGAGVVLGVGALARHPTIVAGLGLLAVQLDEVGGRVRALVRRRAFWGLVIPLVLLGVWPLFNYVTFGRPFWFIAVRRGWGWHAYLSVPGGLRRWHEAKMLLVYPFVALAPAIGSFLLWRRRSWWPLAMIAVPLTALYWCVGAYGLGRYSASTWPAFLPLGAWLAPRRRLLVAAVVVSAILQGVFLHLFAHAYELQ